MIKQKKARFMSQNAESLWSDKTDGNVARLWKYYMPLARPDILVCSFIINILSLALPMLSLQVYDRIIPNNALETFSYLLLGLLVVLIFETILKIGRSWLAGWAGAKYEHQAGTTALNRLLNSDLEKVEAIPAGIHLDRIASIENVRDFYASQASLAMVDLPFVFLFLGLIFYIGGAVVLVPIIMLLLALAVGIWLARGLKAAVEDRSVWDDRRYNFIIETLGGIHTVKGLAMEALMQRRYERLMASSVDAGHKVTMLASISQAVGGFFSQATLVFVVAVGAFGVIAPNDGIFSLSVGGLAACMLLSGRTVQPVMRALSLWTQYQSVLVAEKKLNKVDELPRDTISEGEKADVETLELKDAAFRFNPDMPFVFENLNLSVKCGEIIGVQGDNGSGKTALLHSLMGRLKLEKGSLLVNGRNSSEFSMDYIRPQIAYLPQRPILMQGTVLENLTFFRSREYLDIALDYAARLGLDAIFARMPDGYDTQVGEASASSLPSGVAQRIVIARALALNPKFILFDEANASLDHNGETLLKDLVQSLRGDTGIVLVTYRPSMLSMADRRYILRGGALEPYVAPKRIERPASKIDASKDKGDAS
jgi:ATP-binding cassette subfamily C protein LapB